jgi:hypothetical protein
MTPEQKNGFQDFIRLVRDRFLEGEYGSETFIAADAELRALREQVATQERMIADLRKDVARLVQVLSRACPADSQIEDNDGLSHHCRWCQALGFTFNHRANCAWVAARAAIDAASKLSEEGK